ncbi:hypothetical protein VIBNISOn1_1670024 [Vibrio nigripulchritudo SOn1]|uniref:Uncharacterized protein n=1 Tax=Vibrio nigripulchritudo SOn1 TaxID=1238450 RepID=A0AAV2VNG6_9VIBR|nr:hypothetical protein VIBNISOn1_1670024 [Vibrio nigripulchritudo SOn1]
MDLQTDDGLVAIRHSISYYLIAIDIRSRYRPLAIPYDQVVQRRGEIIWESSAGIVYV